MKSLFALGAQHSFFKMSLQPRLASLLVGWLLFPIGQLSAQEVAQPVAGPHTAVSTRQEPAFAAPVALPGDTMLLYPARVALNGPGSRATVTAGLLRDNRHVGQLARDLSVETSDGQIARYEDGHVVAVGNGACELVFRSGQLTARLPVTVTGLDRPLTPNFRRDVQAVLAKSGCNMGACHGALAGKGGFRLSLRGYDDEGDYLFITRQARGRRVNPSHPEQSLLLLKPLGQLPHKGGVRFDVQSDEFRVLSAWLAAGAPGPQPEDARLQSLEVLPKQGLLRPGQTQQLVVQGHFSDGTIQDLTKWSKFATMDASVATVTESGEVKVQGQGTTAITVWCLSQNGVSRVISPFDLPSAAPSLAELQQSQNLIDQAVSSSLELLGVPAAPRVADSGYIRRAYLDATGTLPTPEQTQAFMADPDPLKRAKLVDRLLQSDAFVDYWTYQWSDLLLVNSGQLGGDKAMWSYYQWIRGHVQTNTPWDELARQLLTATGSTMENGAANFFVLHEDPQILAENTSMAFLGMSINCAKCHNHPLEKWTNDQYYGMANLFSRVRRKFDDRTGGTSVYVVSSGELIQPRTGRPQPPTPLDGIPLQFHAEEDRRVALAQWLTADSNPYFARAIANRIWANYMGRGLVEPIDDLRLTNPASNESLLEGLANYLKEHHYNLRALMRQIMLSETYQRESATSPENAHDLTQFSHYYPRRMMAEVMLDAFSQVTQVPTEFGEYPRSWRALQLPDSSVGSTFLASFGRPRREVTCSCERDGQPSMRQALNLANGEALNGKLSAENVISQGLAQGGNETHMLETLYWSALSRAPKPEEITAVLELLKEVPSAERRAAWEDIYWSVLTSNEFLFNH